MKNIRLEDSTIEHAVHWLEQYDNKDIISTFSVDKVLKSSEKWTKKLIQKAANVVENSDDIEVVAKLDDGFYMVRLVNKSAFDYEGREMGHCISSYSDKSGSYYSLRDSNNKPHCSIEVQDGSVRQIKGKQNKFVVTKYVKYVVDGLSKLNLDLDDSNDLENLGLLEIDDDRLKFFKNTLKGDIPICRINNKKYLNMADNFWYV